MNTKLLRADGRDNTAPNRAWVQVFRAGRHTASDGTTGAYTTGDLDEIVAAFDQTKDEYQPVLRIGGHDGGAAPAGGRVIGLRRSGEFLEALFETIPVVARAISAGAYNGVSAGLRLGAKIGDRTFGKFLDHVAILGSRIPAVKGLNGPDGLSGLFADNDGPTAVYNFEMEGDHMDEKLAQENLELRDKLRAAEANEQKAKADFEAATAAHAAEIVTIKAAHATEIAAERDKVAQYEAAAAKTEVEAVVDAAVRGGRLAPAVKDNTIKAGLALRSQANFSEADSAFAAWRDSLVKAPKVMDFEEKAAAGGDPNPEATAWEKDFAEGAALAAAKAAK